MKSRRPARAVAPTAAGGPLEGRALTPAAAVLRDLGVIVLVWLIFASWVSRLGPLVAYDTFRDMAYALSIQHGRLWQDPSLPGFRAWYPPGNPLLFAFVSLLTRIPVDKLYMTSVFWLGWLNPVLLYLLVRVTWGRIAAWAALPLVFFGSFWWLAHAAMPIPAVQGWSLACAALLAWTRARRGTQAWAILTGGLAGLTIWIHPICGLMALGAVSIHGWLSPWLGGERDGADAAGRPASAALITCFTALAISAPLLAALLTEPHINSAPRHWFGPELHDPRFAVHLYTPLVIPLGLWGLWIAARHWREQGWLVAYWAIGLAGELAGYSGHDLGWKIPWMLPHEFQWHEHLALLIGAAVAVIAVTARFSQRARSAPTGAAGWGWAVGLVLFAVAPALPSLPLAQSYPIHVMGADWNEVLRVAKWIRTRTEFDAVIACDPGVGYCLSGLTGRKCVALPPGHMNPASDYEQRTSDLHEMLTTSDEDVFRPLAARYQVDYFMAIPAPGATSAARAFYGRWECLEPTDLADTSALIYRIRRTGP
jgi:hypothetical protein